MKNEKLKSKGKEQKNVECPISNVEVENTVRNVHTN